MSAKSTEEYTKKPVNAKRSGPLGAATPLLIAIGSIAAVLVIWAATPRREYTPVPTVPPLVNVTVMEIEPIAEFHDTFKVGGVVEANLVVEVAAEVDGQIQAYAGKDDPASQPGVRHISAENRSGKTLTEGDLIEAGKPLVYINDDMIRSEYEGASAQFDYETKHYQRLQDAFKSGVATSHELDGAATKLAVSKASLQGATQRLERTTVFAPITGIINKLPVDVGEYVTSGIYVAQLVDIKTVKILTNVSERDIHYINIADEATISIDSLGGLEVTGKVTYISELADEATRTTRVEITVENPSQKENGRRQLRPGQIVTATLKRGDMKDVIMVPLMAVIPLEDGNTVYVALDDKAQPKKVELGMLKGSKIQIVSGLKAGDQLIIAGNRQLGPGQQIKVIYQ